MKPTKSLLRVLLLLLAPMALFGGSRLRAQEDFYVNADLPWHNAVLDSQGRLLAWYHPEKNLGYDEFMRLDWGFLEHNVPVDPANGLKIYLTHAIFDGKSLQGTYWQHNPASTFAHLVDALVRWYPYSGDEEALPVVRTMLDYQLAHGMTPSNWEWAGVPFATSCNGDTDYGHCLKDMPKGFYGGIETDKVAELGLAFVLVYEMSGDRRYLDAGIRSANALEKHIRPGDADHTPWPFRLDAHTGDVIADEQFGGMIVASVRLFDELIKIGQGDTTSYKKARDMAWQWIMDWPINKHSAAWAKWSGYYEDIPHDTLNVNDMSSIMTAYYILSQDDPATVDPNWLVDVRFLIDRSRSLLGRGPFFGAWAIDEQLRPDGGFPGITNKDFATNGGAIAGAASRVCCSGSGLVCRTSQWGAINAMFYAKSKDGSARENAFRSLNYATYFASSDGKISATGHGTGDKYWFEDGYSDAGRSFMWALGAVPAFAPIGQDHLLNSTSTVQKVKYGANRVEYRTFGQSGTELLRLSFLPARVTAGGAELSKQDALKGEGYSIQPIDGGDYVVRVNHMNSPEVVIAGKL